MDLVISFLVGFVIGGGIGFLVYRNNKKRFAKLEKELRS